MIRTPSAEQLVDVLAVADRRRRAAGAIRAVARLAPILAGLLLAVSTIVRVAGWPTNVTVATASSLGTVVAVAWWIGRRRRPVGDAVAAEIDSDAGLSGELRSAFWFASRAVQDEWIGVHLDRAADRAQAVAWSSVYPAPTAGRAWIVTATLVLAAFVLPASVPSSWVPDFLSTSEGVVTAESDRGLDGLPPDLLEQLDQLLAAVEAGDVTAVEAMVSAREFTEMAEVDSALQREIEDLLREAESRDGDPAAQENAAMADVADSENIEWARNNEAARLANEEAQQGADPMPAAETEGAEPPELEGSGPTTEQPAQGETGESSEGTSAVRVPVSAAGDLTGATGMMTDEDGQVGDPGRSLGGKRGNVRYGTSDEAEIAAALKREEVAAATGLESTMLGEELERFRTEPRESALAFTGDAGRAGFDPSELEAPGPVPEGRRRLIERYFVRPPQVQNASQVETQNDSPSPASAPAGSE